jgi:HNH endonuclease
MSNFTGGDGDMSEAKKDTPVAIDAARLRALFHYNAFTGQFTRLATAKSVGSRHSKGYVELRVDGRLYLCHRLAWLYAHGRWPDHQIDHVNGVRSDNALSNLRECTNAENCQNVASHRDGTSAHAGVCRAARPISKPWLAQICISGKQKRLGSFATEAEAVAARYAAKAHFHTFSPNQRVA